MPTPARARRPVGFQQWRDLLFLHWPMPARAVRPLVPAGLELDLLEDRAYVTLIPFAIPHSRPVGVPPMLAARFLETNLRTYVRGADGERGIYFFSLEASSLVAVAGARLLYGLPYFLARLAMRRTGARVTYESRRVGDRDIGIDVAWSVGERLGTAAAGSRDQFLLERYTLYVRRGGTIYRARVRHPAYPLERAMVEHLAETLLPAAGLHTPTEPPLCHHSPGVDVEIFWLERVGPARSR